MVREPEIKKQAVMLRGFFAEQGVTLTHRQSLDRVAQLHGHPSWQVMEKHLKTPAKANSRTVIEQFDPNREVAIVWSINDVLTIRPDLTDEECLDVLHTVKNRHDCEVGINWTTIEQATTTYPYWSLEAEYQIECTDKWHKVTVILSDGSVIQVPREVYLASEVEFDFVNVDQFGTLRFKELPDVEFYVNEGCIASDAGRLADICAQLREAGATNDGREKPRSDWSWSD